MKHKLFIVLLLSPLIFPSCKKNSDTQTIDADGNIYPVVTIGKQTWMAKNLKTTHYQNGDEIPTGYDDTSATGNTFANIGLYTIYNSDPANDAIYGKLYNWYAAVDPRNICPLGWHVPTEDDWNTLTDNLGGTTVAGGNMKDTTLWQSPNGGATNSSGFSGLPGGYRSGLDGHFAQQTIGGYFLTHTTNNGFTGNALIFKLYYSYEHSNFINFKKGEGASCRCVKD